MTESYPYLELDILIRTTKSADPQAIGRMTQVQKDLFVRRFTELVESFGWEAAGSFTPLKEGEV